MDAKIAHIICPYCCHRFAPKEADFRLPISTLAEKDIKHGNCDGKTLDRKLYEYLIRTLGQNDKESVEKAHRFEAVTVNDPRVTTIASDIEQYGFYSKIFFSSGDFICESEERLCPNCHNALPVGYGLRETILISIIGDARAGKSVYLTMLINELENNRDFPSKLSFIGDADTRELIHDTYQRPLLHERILIDSTKRKRIPPFSYNFWYQYRGENGQLLENSIDVIFYDIAGEDMRDDYAIRRNGFNIRDSSGLIFLLDPTNFRSMRDVFMLKDRSLIDAVPLENSTQRVFSAMFNYFIGMSRDKSSIPLALTISKVDLFRFADLDFFATRPDSRLRMEHENESYKGFINMRVNRGMNHEIKELLSYLNEDNVLHNAYGCFKEVSCFAVSSLGRKPISEKISDPITNETVEHGYINGDPEPFRVKDPFYWILLKNNLLYYHEDGEYYRNNEKPKQKSQMGMIGRILSVLRKLSGKH